MDNNINYSDNIKSIYYNYSDNINSGNKNSKKTTLSFLHNIYYINNINYKRCRVNPIYNNKNQNSFYDQNNSNNQNMNMN